MAISRFYSRAAYPLARAVTAAGVSLQVNPERSLAALIDTAAAVTAMSVNGGPAHSEDGVVEQAEQLFLGEDGGGNNLHDMAMEAIVHNGILAVNAMFSIARNRVVPEIEELVRVAEEYITSRQSAQSEPYHIRSEFVDDLFTDASLSGMYGPYVKSDGVSFPQVNLNVAYPGDIDSAFAADLDPELQRRIHDRFDGRNDYVKDTWNQFFQGSDGNYRDEDMHRAISDADTAALVFLGAQKLLNSDVPDSVRGISLAEYRAHLSQLLEFSGMKLALYSDQMAKNLTSGVLAKKIPAMVPGSQVDLPVSGEIYNDYLAKGGSPEAVFGAAILKKALNVVDLIENHETYVSEWARYIAARRSKADFDSISHAISGLRLGLLARLDATPDESLPADRHEMIDRINERLTHFHAKDKDNLYGVACKAICRLFYPNGDLEKILRAIDYIASRDPDLTPREAAATAQIDYVADWLATSILIDGKPIDQVKSFA